MTNLQNYAITNNFRFAVNEDLKKYTSFKIGGPADLILFPETGEQAAELLRICRIEAIPFFVLGGGSNLLALDDGFRGALISTKELLDLRLDGTNRIICASGVKLKNLCQFALDSSLTGLEFAFGIPGTAGGAAFMNAGAYGGEMKDVLRACKYIDTNGNTKTARGDELELSYRHSIFADNAGVILELELELEAGNPTEIYEKMVDFLGRRRDKQPLEFPSAGSVFKRPEDDFAGRLIEVCGLRGYQIGSAQVSEKHCGFIVNKGGASCADVLALVEHIRTKVLEETGVTLESEIRLLKPYMKGA